MCGESPEIYREFYDKVKMKECAYRSIHNQVYVLKQPYLEKTAGMC